MFMVCVFSMMFGNSLDMLIVIVSRFRMCWRMCLCCVFVWLLFDCLEFNSFNVFDSFVMLFVCFDGDFVVDGIVCVWFYCFEVIGSVCDVLCWWCVMICVDVIICDVWLIVVEWSVLMLWCVVCVWWCCVMLFVLIVWCVGVRVVCVMRILSVVEVGMSWWFNVLLMVCDDDDVCGLMLMLLYWY